MYACGKHVPAADRDAVAPGRCRAVGYFVRPAGSLLKRFRMSTIRQIRSNLGLADAVAGVWSFALLDLWPRASDLVTTALSLS